MRKHHYTPPAKWLKEFRRAQRLGETHYRVYSYLESGPESHATGLYFILPATIAGMLDLDADEVLPILDELQKAGLILWDRRECVVCIPCMCAEQFRWTGKQWKRADNRVAEARQHIDDLPESWIVKSFLERWPIFIPELPGANLQAPIEAPIEAPGEGTPTPTPTPAPTATADIPN